MEMLTSVWLDGAGVVRLVVGDEGTDEEEVKVRVVKVVGSVEVVEVEVEAKVESALKIEFEAKVLVDETTIERLDETAGAAQSILAP